MRPLPLPFRSKIRACLLVTDPLPDPLPFPLPGTARPGLTQKGPRPVPLLVRTCGSVRGTSHLAGCLRATSVSLRSAGPFWPPLSELGDLPLCLRSIALWALPERLRDRASVAWSSLQGGCSLCLLLQQIPCASGVLHAPVPACGVKPTCAFSPLLEDRADAKERSLLAPSW